MADIAIDAAGTNTTLRGMRSLVFISQTTGYFFFVDGDTDFYYTKTTNGGITWGTPVSISGVDTMAAFDVWYDQWTPGNTERNIHIWWFGNSTTDDPTYSRLNTVDDTLTTVAVVAATSVASARGIFISGTRTRGGTLLCAFDLDAGAEHGMYKSTNNGASWAVMTDPVEATLDQAFLFPANAADPNDAWLLYDDDSTAELTIKTYDDSGNSFSESGALTFDNNATDLTGQYGFGGSIRHSDGHLIFAFFNAYDGAGEDFLCYDWDGTTATALTALTTDIDDMYYPSVYLNQDQPDYIYIAYVGKSDGLETLGTTNAVYYALSKDRGLTWTKDIAYSTSSTDYRRTWVPLNGERFMVAWMDISAVSFLTNNDNSKEFGFTKLNNYQAPTAVGYNNTGVIQVAGKG